MDHVRAGESPDRVNDEVALLSEVCRLVQHAL